MEQLQEVLPLLVPILIIQIALVVYALLDLIRRPITRGPKWLWLLVILFINLIGPIVYLIVGRDEG
jgi:hypothetical protein